MTIATIRKRFTFEAAHRLSHLEPTHKCSRPHGHSYGVWLECKGEIDPDMGWVRDYAELSAVFKKGVHWHLDHENVDNVFTDTGWHMRPSTAENLCLWILERAPDWITAVEVEETETTSVRIER